MYSFYKRESTPASPTLLVIWVVLLLQSGLFKNPLIPQLYMNITYEPYSDRQPEFHTVRSCLNVFIDACWNEIQQRSPNFRFQFLRKPHIRSANSSYRWGNLEDFRDCTNYSFCHVNNISFATNVQLQINEKSYSGMLFTKIITNCI